MRARGLGRARAVVVLVALVLAACAAPAVPTPTPISKQAATPSPTAVPTGRGAGDTLRLLYWQAPTLLNPHLSAGSKDIEVSRITYEPLASYDANGTLVPFLAAEIPSRANGGLAADGRSVTWKLRPDVIWSDGEPFTAEDVRFTHEFVANPAVGAVFAALYDPIKRVEALDPYTVRVDFKAPNPAWAVPFVGASGMILPRHKFAAFNGANARQAPANRAPVGTGPYRVVGEIRPQETIFLGNELIETNKIVFEPNPFFRESEKPFFRRIELHGGGTVMEAARSVLKDGLIDYAYNLQLSAPELAGLEAGGKGKQATIFGSRVDQIVVNMTDPNAETADGERSSLQFPHPIFGDKRVRQALAHAINRAAIADLYGVAGRPTTNVLVAPPAYVSTTPGHGYDPVKAAALLDAAGWRVNPADGLRTKGGVRLRLVFQTALNPVYQQIQRLVKADLARVGIDVQTPFVDSSVFFSNDPSNPSNAFRFQADLQGFFIEGISPDPGALLQYWTCAQIPQKANGWAAGLNFGRWCDPAYDAQYARATAELDPERQRALYIAMNDFLVDEVVTIPVVHLAQVSGLRQDLAGVVFTPWDAETWLIKDWRRSTP